MGMVHSQSEFVEENMHRVFGTKKDEKYVDRKGAYIIPIRENEIGVVETPKGFFVTVEFDE